MNENLINYIQDNIFPEYSKNDDGHNLKHIEYVIDRCIRFSKQFDNIDLDMLYTIAAFHDIAHHIDKKNHEILSARIFFENDEMKPFFTDEQRIIIKEAIEDHRASSNHAPRSDYGKIISSADRSTDVNDFLRRTHQYTLKHFSECSYEEMISRAYQHTLEKYGNNGYAKHYLIDVEYDDFREEINRLLVSRKTFEEKYKNINSIK